MTDAKEKNSEILSFAPTSTQRTKAGRVRELYDEIERAHRNGWQYEKIVVALRAQSLDLNVVMLRQMLMRIRREGAKEQQKSGLIRNAPKREPFKASGVTADMPKTDPLARSSLVLSKDGFRDPAPTFEYDPTKPRKFNEN
jgi:hypothetical protein